MGTADLKFGVLGPLLISVDDVVIALGAPKQRAVLAGLLLNSDRPVAAESLINVVWHDAPIPAARATIQTYISNLRKILRDTSSATHGLLVNRPPGYQFSVSSGHFDMAYFNARKISGIQAMAAGRFEQASSDLSAALAEWRGPALDDLRDFAFFDPWVAALTDDKLATLTAFAEVEIACGRADSIIAELENLASENRHREPLWLQLISAYYATKRQSDALNAYQRLKNILAEDLGIDPDPAIKALHAKILRQEPLDFKRAAQTAAAQTVAGFRPCISLSNNAALAWLSDEAGRKYSVRPSAAVQIGRLSDNDIILGDASISRRHAAVVDTGAGFIIMDLRSANGVYVQGCKIDTSRFLVDGDIINIGNHEFIFRVEK